MIAKMNDKPSVELLKKGRHSKFVKNNKYKLFFSIGQLCTYLPLLAYYLAIASII